MQPDFLTSLGPLGLTLRLSRLTEQLSQGGRLLYAQQGVPLQPHWYVILMLLRSQDKALGITEIATHLELSHPSIIAIARRMTEANLLESTPDPGDKRRRLLRLSAEAVERLPGFDRLWDAFAAELTALLDRSGEDLLRSVGELERQLKDKGLAERVQRRLSDGASPLRRRGPRETKIRIRRIVSEDRPVVLRIARELVRAGDTYAFDANISDAALWRYWTAAKPGQGFVAERGDEAVGVFVIRPNHAGVASHVANASYAVRGDVRGLGIGRTMALQSLELATELGFRALQFNLVVSTNLPAIRLWLSLGFRIIGTVPDGFRLPSGDYVAHHIMYRKLGADSGSLLGEPR